MLPTKKYKVKVVGRPDLSNGTAQPPQTNLKATVNSESQKPSKNNPLPLESAPVHTDTPWPEARKMSGNLLELKKDWPIPSSDNTMNATNSKLPIKIKPQGQDQPTPVQQHQNQSNVDGDQIVPFARMQKKIGMANTKSSSSKPTNTLKHRINSKRILSRPKTQGRFRLRTLSAPKTTIYHKIPSPPRHNPLMYQTDMWSKSV